MCAMCANAAVLVYGTGEGDIIAQRFKNKLIEYKNVRKTKSIDHSFTWFSISYEYIIDMTHYIISNLILLS